MLIPQQDVCDVCSILTTPDYTVVARTVYKVMPGMYILILATIHEHEYLAIRCCAHTVELGTCAQL